MEMEDLPDPFAFHACENYCLSCATEFKTSVGLVQTEKITYFGVTAVTGQEDCEFISVSAALNFIFQFPPSNNIDERYEKRLGCCPVCSGVIGQLYGLHKQLQALNNSKSMISTTMKSALESVALKSVVPIRSSVIVPDSQYPSKRLCSGSGAAAGSYVPKAEFSQQIQLETVDAFIENSYGIPVELQSVKCESDPMQSYPHMVTSRALLQSQPDISPSESLSEVPESMVESVYILPEVNKEPSEDENDVEASQVRKTRASAWEESQVLIGVCYEVCAQCGVGVEQEKDGRGMERHDTVYHKQNTHISNEEDSSSGNNNGHDSRLSTTFGLDEVKWTQNGNESPDRVSQEHVSRN